MRRQTNLCSIYRLLGILSAIVAIVFPMHNVAASPSLADPTRFRIEPYAGLSAFPFNWTFDMTLTNGQDGFPAGLYIPSGPSFQGDSEKRRLFRVSSPGQVNVVEDRFTSGVESVVFAKGQYGNCMLLSQPQEQKILRLQADGTLTTFTSLGTRPFGPAGIAFGADGFLYAADFTAVTFYVSNLMERVRSLPVLVQRDRKQCSRIPRVDMAAD